MVKFTRISCPTAGAGPAVPSPRFVTSVLNFRLCSVCVHQVFWRGCWTGVHRNPLLWNTSIRGIIMKVERGGKEQSCVYSK